MATQEQESDHRETSPPEQIGKTEKIKKRRSTNEKNRSGDGTLGVTGDGHGWNDHDGRMSLHTGTVVDIHSGIKLLTVF